jgi:signal transduction histidine kinase
MVLSIRTKIVIITSAIVLVTLGATTLVDNHVFTREYSRALHARGQDIAAALDAQLDRLLALGIPLENLVGFDEQCREVVRKHADVAYALVLGRDGRVLFRGDRDERGAPALDPEAPGQRDSGGGLSVAVASGVRYENVSAPIVDPDGRPVGTIVIGFPTAMVAAATRTQMLYSAGVLVVSLGAAMVSLLALLSWWVTTPLNAVIGRIAAVRDLRRDAAPRPARPKLDELGQLSAAFEDMTRRLDEYDEQIRQHTVELESRVEERTAELKRSNAELEVEVERRARVEAELRVKNSELDSFVYSVSHDLKAPLVAVQGLAGILAEDHGAHLDADGRHVVDRLQANVDRMKRLIEDLLELSRIGREARAPQALDLSAVVDGLVAEMGAALRARGIELVRRDAGLVWAVRTRLEQVLRNLLGNAVKYMGETASPRIEVGLHAGGAFAECYVKDNGIGIDPRDHEKIFDIFHRLNEVQVEGTGVGLAIARKIVDGVGGRLWVESERGRGATFRFTWPSPPGVVHPEATCPDDGRAPGQARAAITRSR